LPKYKKTYVSRISENQKFKDKFYYMKTACIIFPTWDKTKPMPHHHHHSVLNVVCVCACIGQSTNSVLHLESIAVAILS